MWADFRHALRGKRDSAALFEQVSNKNEGLAALMYE